MQWKKKKPLGKLHFNGLSACKMGPENLSLPIFLQLKLHFAVLGLHAPADQAVHGEGSGHTCQP